MIKMSDAFKEFHTAQERADEAAKVNSPDAAQLQEIADTWEKAIMDAAPDELGQQWRAARAEYGRGMRYQELIGGTMSKPGPAFDVQAMIRKMNSDPERYGPDALPGLHKSFGLVGEPGTWRLPTLRERIGRALGRWLGNRRRPMKP